MPTCRQKCTGIPKRWMIVLACFLSLFDSANVQIGLSVAITQMVLPKNHTVEVTSMHQIQHERFAHNMTFDWDEKTQGKILSAYYWGYIITCILSGTIINKLGGKYAMSLSILSASLLTLLVPKVVEWYDSTGLIILRFLTGLGAGMISPAVMRLISQWIPEDERSTATTWAYAGGTFGQIVGTSASGFIISRFETGWPAMFYTFGLFGIFVVCIQIVICYDSPSEHPCISKSETKYLKEKLKHTHTDIPPTPWYHIIRSRPIWGLLFAFIGNGWCYITMISVTPKFMSSVLGFNVETSGFVSSFPHVGSWVVACILSWTCDGLISKKLVRTTCIRKVCNSIAMPGSGIFLVIGTYVGRNPTLVVSLYVFAAMLFSSYHVSSAVNVLDLAPNYAGPIFGINVAVSMGAVFMAPYVAGLLTPNQTIDEWRLVFWLILGIGTFSNAIFVIFGDAEVQEWNDPKYLLRGKPVQDDDVKEIVELVAKKKMKRIDGSTATLSLKI